jgi:hypothetical protein
MGVVDMAGLKVTWRVAGMSEMWPMADHPVGAGEGQRVIQLFRPSGVQ